MSTATFKEQASTPATPSTGYVRLYAKTDKSMYIVDDTGAETVLGGGGGGLSDVVDDLSPQLGANLDVNSFSIVSAAAGDIAITPDTTGDVILDGLKWPQADGAASQSLVTNGAAQLSWATRLANVVEDTTPELGGNLSVAGNKIVSAGGGNIDIEPNGTGNVLLGNLTFDADQAVGAGTDNYALIYDNGTGLISLEALPSSGWADMTEAVWTGGTQSEVADGASAVAFDLQTDATYSTAGANLLRLGNNTTTVLDFSFQGGIDHVNSGASTAAHSQSLNLNWASATTSTSSGQYSVVIGDNNRASGLNAMALGVYCVASGTAAVAIGNTCTASAENAVSLGRAGTASGRASTALGWFGQATNPFEVAIGASNPAGQSKIFTAYKATTDATQTTIATAYGTMATIPADTTWCFTGLVVARSDETDGNLSAGWKFEGVLYRDESNNTVIQGVTVTNIYDGAAAAWSVAVEADDTSELLAVKVTGEAATNITWAVRVDAVHVTYA